MKTSLLSFFNLAAMAAAQGPLLPGGVTRVPFVSGAVLPTGIVSAVRIGGGGLAGGASGFATMKPVVVTTVVDYFVSIFPQPTTVTINNICYTATSSRQPVTISNCPCTVVHFLAKTHSAQSPTPKASSSASTTGLVTGRLITPPASRTLVPPPPSQQTGAAGSSIARSLSVTTKPVSGFASASATSKTISTSTTSPGQPSSPYVQAAGNVNFPHALTVLLAAVPLAAAMVL
ncbi:hypothetical protein BD289DRAFT_451185 [Coniella lustricola]|uniref:Uncharacterized protein n=1 Tax=Coniella lustricola TaxID=2025994 RepID=A0A2T3AG50_9PEZI|nr:hypothetical protein BD289DRAFT_451185 [Coniella lustricola]